MGCEGLWKSEEWCLKMVVLNLFPKEKYSFCQGHFPEIIVLVIFLTWFENSGEIVQTRLQDSK